MVVPGDVIVGINHLPHPPGGIVPLPPPVIIHLPPIRTAFWKERIFVATFYCIFVLLIGVVEWATISGFINPGNREETPDKRSFRKGVCLFLAILIFVISVLLPLLLYFHQRFRVCTWVNICIGFLLLLVLSGMGVSIYGFIYYEKEGKLGEAVICLIGGAISFVSLMLVLRLLSNSVP